MQGVPDGATGVDIQELRKRMEEAEKEADGIDRPVSLEYPRYSLRSFLCLDVSYYSSIRIARVLDLLGLAFAQ